MGILSIISIAEIMFPHMYMLWIVKEIW